MFILKFASISQNVSELPQHDTQYCASNTTRSTVQATRHAVLCKQHTRIVSDIFCNNT